MCACITGEELLGIVAKQEQMLRFESFTNEEALSIGVQIAQLARDSERPIALRIYRNDIVVFQYCMEGKEKSHLRWTERKHHTVCATGHSTMYARILVKCLDDRSVFDGAPDDVTVGTGGFPLVVGGELVGSICVSGLVDPGDHLLIVRALAEYLHRDVPPLPERVEMGWLPSM